MHSQSFRNLLYATVLASMVCGCGIKGSRSDNVVLVNDEKSRAISARLMFGYDTSKHPAGTGWMVARGLSGPFSDVAAKRLAQISDLGVTLHVHAGREVLIVDVDCPKSAWEQVEPLLAQFLTKQTIESVRIDELKLLQHAAIDSLRHDSAALARVVFWNSVYEGTPFAVPPTGSDSSIEKITQADLMSFMTQFLTKENFVLGMAGPVSNSDADQFLSLLSETLPSGKPIDPAPVASQPHGLNVRIVQGDSAQGASVIVGTTTPHVSADSSATVLAWAAAVEVVPGASLTGIDQSLRKERGIVDVLDAATSRIASTHGGVQLQSDDPQHGDYLYLTAHALQINALYVARIILKELSDINTAGLSTDEMTAMDSKFDAALTSAGAVYRMRQLLAMQWMGTSESANLTQTAVSVTPSRSRQFVRKSFDPKDMWIIAVVPDAQSLRASILGGMSVYTYPDWVNQLEIRSLDVEYVSFRPFWQEEKIRLTEAAELFR